MNSKSPQNQSNKQRFKKDVYAKIDWNLRLVTNSLQNQIICSNFGRLIIFR